jgi:2-polyprenyl-6-methoxyphenol hydroxylase-like FAD-dependent oxidoreductase
MNAGMNIVECIVDVLVIGGGTAGPMAAVKAKQVNPALEVPLLEWRSLRPAAALPSSPCGAKRTVGLNDGERRRRPAASDILKARNFAAGCWQTVQSRHQARS